MREARIGHSATTLSDGRVLILGGFNGSYLKTAELFDPRTGRFSAAGSMNVGRSGHTATLLGDGTVLVTGGVGDGWTFLSSAETYDPATGRSALVKPLSVGRESHTATLLRDGRVMIAGGHRDRRENIVTYASTEIYDPSQRRFTAAPALTIARHKHEAAALADGRVWCSEDLILAIARATRARKSTIPPRTDGSRSHPWRRHATSSVTPRSGFAMIESS